MNASPLLTNNRNGEGGVTLTFGFPIFAERKGKPSRWETKRGAALEGHNLQQ